MNFLRRHPIFSSVTASVAVTAALFFYRSRRINTWELVNDPPSAGRVVCFGDSLVYGSGATSEDFTYPAWLGTMTSRVVHSYGYPGATTETALQTLRNSSEISGAIVIVTLGGNDFLKRVTLEETLDNLGHIFEILQEREALVVYTGVPNGRTSSYRQLCKRHGVLLVPELLDDILSDRSLKADHIHPNDRGYRILAERVHQVLEQHAL